MNKIIKPINTEKATKIEEVKRRTYEIKREEKTKEKKERKKKSQFLTKLSLFCRKFL